MISWFLGLFCCPSFSLSPDQQLRDSWDKGPPWSTLGDRHACAEVEDENPAPRTSFSLIIDSSWTFIYLLYILVALFNHMLSATVFWPITIPEQQGPRSWTGTLETMSQNKPVLFCELMMSRTSFGSEKVPKLEICALVNYPKTVSSQIMLSIK